MFLISLPKIKVKKMSITYLEISGSIKHVEIYHDLQLNNRTKCRSRIKSDIFKNKKANCFN